MKDERSLAGLRVRHRVVDLLHRAPQHETPLPSVAELARQCNVSTSTVNRELKKLVEEGLIVGKQGIGMFTVPGTLAFNDLIPGRRIVGIVYGDGRFLYYSTMEWIFIFQCGLALLPRIAHPRNITLISSHYKDVVAEIQSLNLDGLIAISPAENLQKALFSLRQNNFPVVVLEGRVDGIPAILADHRRAGREMGAMMLRQHVHSVLWMSFDAVCRKQLAGVRLACSDARHSFKVTEVANMGEVETALEQCAAAGVLPDAVYAHGETACCFQKLLQERNLDGSRCLMLTEAVELDRENSHREIIRTYPFREMAEQAAACLEAMFAGQRTESEYLFPFQITERLEMNQRR